MDRATLKVRPDTAHRLRIAMPDISSNLGVMATIDQAINYLLDCWYSELAQPERTAQD